MQEVIDMPANQYGPSILNPAVYQDLREKGYSKRKSARISNAMATHHKLHGRKAHTRSRGKRR